MCALNQDSALAGRGRPMNPWILDLVPRIILFACPSVTTFIGLEEPLQKWLIGWITKKLCSICVTSHITNFGGTSRCTVRWTCRNRVGPGHEVCMRTHCAGRYGATISSTICRNYGMRGIPVVTAAEFQAFQSCTLQSIKWIYYWKRQTRFV